MAYARAAKAAAGQASEAAGDIAPGTRHGHSRRTGNQARLRGLEAGAVREPGEQDRRPISGLVRMPAAELAWRAAVHRAAASDGAPLADRAAHGPAAPRGVRVHTDEASGEAARRLSARAFTIGSHIFFGRGEYAPSGGEGARLLSHELTHVAQDPATPLSDAWKLPLSSPGDATERAATDVAAAYPAVVPHHHGPAARPAIRRVLAAYSASHSEMLPTMGQSAWVTSVTSNADSARIRAALSALIAANKIEVSSIGDRDFFALPATGAATSVEVTAAFTAAGMPRVTDLTTALMDRHNATLFTGQELTELHGLWTMEVSRTSNVTRQTDRPLTSEERAEATIVFGPGLNYSAIRITEDPVLGVGGTARTLPSGINFPVGASSDAGYIPWLIHELTHSWQYQHGRSVAATLSTAILCYAHIRSYSYGGRPALAAATAAGQGLSHFNTEQQGEIAMDYYNDKKAGSLTAGDAEYAPFVAELRVP